jgi:hypothetical protein
MGQDGIPMSIAVLFVGVILGVVSIVGVIIAVVLSSAPA